MAAERTWLSEFGEAYRPPEEVLHLVAAGVLTDESWHNDASPSFERKSDDGRSKLRLWVEHPDPAKRECPGARFIVARYGDGGEVWETLAATDDVHKALRAMSGEPTWGVVGADVRLITLPTEGPPPGFLPPEPQDDAALRARLPAALATVWSAGAMEAAAREGRVDFDRPGRHRANVFDTLGGLRLTISREYDEDGIEYLHVAAAVWDDDVARLIGERWRREGPRMVLEVFEAITGFDLRGSSAPKPVVSAAGIIHLVYPLSTPTSALAPPPPPPPPPRRE